MSLHQVLEIVRARPGLLPEAVAFHLLRASVVCAAPAAASLRPAHVVLDGVEGLLLDVSPSPSASAEIDLGYVAPEALTGRALPDDPRVLVYAAGALGYQLLTLEVPPSSPDRSRPELQSPVGQVVRAALAPNPQERIPTLEEMARALQAVYPAPPPPIERHLFGAVVDSCFRWSEEGAAVQLAVIANRMESAGEKLPAERMLRWMQEVDASLERQQRRQIDVVLALAGQQPARPQEPAADAPAAQTREQIELLHRVAALASAGQTGSGRRRRSPGLAWRNWAGPAVLSAAVAWLVANGNPLPRLSGSPAAPVSPEAHAEASAPAEHEPEGSERTIIASPIVLSSPGAREGTAEPVEPPPPQATRGPATPRASQQPPKLVTSRSPSSGEDLLAKGERALGEGRPADALAAFNAALESQPDLAPAVRGLGLAYLMQRRDAEAKAQLERYLQLAPDADDAPRMRKLASSLAGGLPGR
jgi:tetratricopeptide (TPR) repeat protein